MQKNVAGQKIGVQMVSASDGSAFTGSVTVYVTGDAGTQAIGSVGSGVCTHEGNGYHSYAPAQAETNFDLIAFTFLGSGAVPVTVQVYTAINPVTAVPTAAAIADAVLEESILDHRNVAHSLAKYIYQIKQATLTIDGVVSNAITPTTLTFSSNVSATTSAYAHAVLLFVSGPLTGENSPIISYNNTNGVFVLEEALTAAPSDGDEFVVIAGSHVHAIADIAAAIDITVAPLQATAPNRVAGTEIVTYINDTSDIGPIVVTDGDGDAVDLSSYTLKVCIERKETGTIDDNITPTISGAGNNQVTFTPTAACVNSTTPRKWSLRSTSNGQVFAFGDFKVEWPARLS